MEIKVMPKAFDRTRAKTKSDKSRLEDILGDIFDSETKNPLDEEDARNGEAERDHPRSTEPIFAEDTSDVRIPNEPANFTLASAHIDGQRSCAAYPRCHTPLYDRMSC